MAFSKTYRSCVLVTLLGFTAGCTGAVESPGLPVDAEPGSGGSSESAQATGGAQGAGSTQGTGGRPAAGGPSTATGGASHAGASANGGTAGAAVANCVTPSPGSAPLRRLSNAEYKNTLRDLLAAIPGIEAEIVAATQGLPAEAESLGFRNNAEFLTVQPLLAQNYSSVAERLAAKVASSTALLPCTPQAQAELACARQFIDKFGRAAYRRPLSSDESARYEAIFQSGFKEKGFAMGVEWVVFSMLQSPGFLYRAESAVTPTTPDPSGLVRPTRYQMASRLAYLFWQSSPDEALLTLAESGALDTREGIEKQARAMLADKRAERLFQYFAEWLDLDHLDEFTRDAQAFPNLPSQLPSWFREETRSFVSSLLKAPDGNLTQLLTAPYTFANSGLASHYGLPGVTGDAFVRVADAKRSGVLTQALLMTRDKPYRTSIVRRGLKIRTDFLCQNIPAPPNDVPLNLDSAASTLSQRERLAQHRADPSCASCHNLLDSVGLVFETFDAVGRFRSQDERGQPIDTAVELTATRDIDGPIADVRELGARLAASEEVQDCYLKQTFRFFFGREVEAADACSMAQLRQVFRDHDQSLSELLVALTQTDAFLYLPQTSEVSR